MDIKKIIEDLVKKITGDKGLLSKFQKNPLDTVKSLVGKDVPEGQLGGIVEGIKGKIKLDSIGSSLSGLFGKK